MTADPGDQPPDEWPTAGQGASGAPGATDDQRLERVVDLIVELASGDLTARLEPSPARDTIDAVITGINLLADELHDVYQQLEHRVSERTAQLLDAQQDLQRLALGDPLTGLANRTLLGDRIDQAIARAERGSVPPAVLILDLDEFKTINDSLGHLAGDTALKEVATRLRALVREGDTVARLGGDEFAILMPEADEDEAVRIAEAALLALQKPVALGDRLVWASASIGLRLGQRGQTGGILLRDADTAMYAAKAKGRGNVQIYRPAMHFAVQERLQVASDLSQAIGRDELKLHYQPVVDLTTRTVTGAEALLRWAHPQRGLVLPDEFVPVAEDSGLIIDVGRWVAEAAIRQLAAWEPQLPAAFQLHVNVSPVELRRPGLAEHIEDLLTDHRVAPTRLALEISETSLMTGDVAGMETLLGLQALGVSIEIDDFGTGYSSISYLRGLPINAVKVDRSLIVDMESDDRQRRFIGAILQMIESVGLGVIVEGVETPWQAKHLSSLGYRFAQGFHFSPPVTAGQLAAMLTGDTPLGRWDE